MAQILSGVRSILSIPSVYDRFQFLIGSRRGAQDYVKHYVKPNPQDKILDIGCGTSKILSYLPSLVSYVGFDLSAEYIASAQSQYGGRGRWQCAPVSEMDVDELGTYDIVMANGILHHLDDSEVMLLAEIAAKALKPSGRFCSLDCTFVEGQSKLARYIVSKDRGQNIRKPDEYVDLVRPYFASIALSVRHDMLRVPYTHAIIVATNEG